MSKEVSILDKTNGLIDILQVKVKETDKKKSELQAIIIQLNKIRGEKGTVCDAFGNECSPEEALKMFTKLEARIKNI